MPKRISRRAALAAGAAGAAGLSASAAPVPKRDDKGLIGQTVLPKTPDPTAAPVVPPPNAQPGREYLCVLGLSSWEVKGTKEHRSVVFESGRAFLIETDKFVPLTEAVEFFTRELKARPDDAYSYNSRGWAHHLLGKPDAALADYDAFLKAVGDEHPSHRAVVLANRGLLLAETGKFDAAHKDLDAAVEWREPLAWLNRGYAYELAGEFTKAVAAYDELLLALPDVTEALNNLAWVRATCPDAKLRDGKSAVALVRGLCEHTENREGRYLDTLAAAHAETGAFKKAVAAQELALEDRGFARRYGAEATARLRLYKDEKPFRTAPPK